MGFGPVFGCHAHMMKKNPIGYSDAEYYAGHFEIFFPKISNCKKPRPTMKIFGRAISSHIINFRLLSFSEHFQTQVEKFFASSRSRKISCSRRKNNFEDILRGSDFMADQKKSLFHYISLFPYLRSVR